MPALDFANPGPLFRGRVAVVRFRASHEFLNGVSVRVGTGRRRVDSTATLTLYDRDATTVLRRVARSTLEFDDGEWELFPFESIAQSGGITYCFTLATDAEDEAVWVCGEAACEYREHYFDELAYLLDPLLFRGRAAPRIPQHLTRYLDRHVYECIRLKRYFFLRVVHLADALGRIGHADRVTRVLSVGAGAAFQEAFIAGRFAHMQVHATDVEPCPIEYPMPNLTFGRLDLLAGPGAAEHDLVFSIECLEHIADYRTAFRNKVSRVAPGKYLYVSVPFASKEEQQDEQLRRHSWEHAQHVTPGFAFTDLEELFADNGLDVIHASNMFWCELVHPLRALADRLDDAALESGAAQIARLYLNDVREARARDSKEAEGIRFLGRKRG
jgi:hypothetical protein